jgi:hypothetical protein
MRSSAKGMAKKASCGGDKHRGRALDRERNESAGVISAFPFTGIVYANGPIAKGGGHIPRGIENGLADMFELGEGGDVNGAKTPCISGSEM